MVSNLSVLGINAKDSVGTETSTNAREEAHPRGHVKDLPWSILERFCQRPARCADHVFVIFQGGGGEALNPGLPPFCVLDGIASGNEGGYGIVTAASVPVYIKRSQKKWWEGRKGIRKSHMDLFGGR